MRLGSLRGWRAGLLVFCAAATAGYALGRSTAPAPPQTVAAATQAPEDAGAAPRDADCAEVQSATSCTAAADAPTDTGELLSLLPRPADDCPGAWPPEADHCGGARTPEDERFQDALASPEAPTPAPDPWAFARYHDLRPMPLGEQSFVNGLPLKLAVLHAPEGIDDVVAYYVKRFEREGLKPLAGKMNPEGTQYFVSFHPAAGNGLNLVSLVADVNGTEIFAGTSEEIGHLMSSDYEHLPPDVPSPGAPSHAMVSEFRESGQRHRSITFDLQSFDVKRVLEFYATELARRGMHPVAESELESGPLHGLTFESQHEQVSVSASARPGAVVSVVLVWVDR